MDSVKIMCSNRAMNASIVLMTFCLIGTSCWPPGDLGEYEDFYAMPQDQREVAIHKYPLDEQVDIYLAGQRLSHGSRLWFELAKNGASIVPILTKRLATVESDKDKVSLLYLFVIINASKSYPVTNDTELMRTLEKAANSVGYLFRDRALGYIDMLREAEEREP